MKRLNLPEGKYALFGSVPLTAHEIRETHDIDIIVVPDVYARLKREGWEELQLPRGSKVLRKDCFEIADEWRFNSFDKEVAKLIREAENIDGVRVVKLEDVLEWKKAFGREKDLKDAKLIEDELSK